MLCGPAGSGKTTHAEGLVAEGAMKLSIDESMAKHGTAGEDYPVEEYPALEQEVLRENRELLVGAVAVGKSVVLDYGFGRRQQRDNNKALIEGSGGRWRLLYFAMSRDELWRRVRVRNEHAGSNAVLSEQLFDEMFGWFEVPDGEGEEIIAES
jgi:predicted kinase